MADDPDAGAKTPPAWPQPEGSAHHCLLQIPAHQPRWSRDLSLNRVWFNWPDFHELKLQTHEPGCLWATAPKSQSTDRVFPNPPTPRFLTDLGSHRRQIPAKAENDFSRQPHLQGQMKPQMSRPSPLLGPWESWKMLGVTEDPGWGEKSSWNQQACLLNCLKTLQEETWIPRALVPCVISFLTLNQHLLSHLDTWCASPSSLRESLGGLSFRPPKP